MPINVPPPKTVSPGEPVTAEGWNAIVGGIIALTAFLNASEASSMRVVIKNPGVTDARVTATRDDGVTFQAVPPVPPSAEYILAGLRPGAYIIRAEAPGFNVQTTSVTAPVATPVEVSLEANGAFMPELFGLTLRAALQELSGRKIAVSRILDVVGRDVAPANPGSAYNDQPVLAYFPAVGTAVPPSGQVQIVVSAALQVQPSVEVPSLAGLSLAEAQKALEAVGLVLGRVVTKT
jgi:PASTA domain